VFTKSFKMPPYEETDFLQQANYFQPFLPSAFSFG